MRRKCVVVIFGQRRLGCKHSGGSCEKKSRHFSAASNTTVPDNSIAIGLGQTLKNNTNSTLIGNNITTDLSSNVTALGYNTTVLGGNTTAVGVGAYSSAGETVAIGAGVTSTGYKGSSLGYNANAGGAAVLL